MTRCYHSDYGVRQSVFIVPDASAALPAGVVRDPERPIYQVQTEPGRGNSWAGWVRSLPILNIRAVSAEEARTLLLRQHERAHLCGNAEGFIRRATAAWGAWLEALAPQTEESDQGG